jgi:hypothetical protein
MIVVVPKIPERDRAVQKKCVADDAAHRRGAGGAKLAQIGAELGC